jgi:TRAP-type C4-dicarboxylate transport system permease large subunit
MGYVRPKRAKRPANRPKWPSHSFRRRVWATRFFEILDPGAFDEHFFNGLLTIPIFYPMIMGLDFGMPDVDKSVWFGILALMVVEIGLVHPPLGMNLFIIQKLSRDVPYIETAKGVLPFLVSDLVRIVLIAAFPAITLWLLR